MEIHKPTDTLKAAKGFFTHVGTAVLGFLIALLLNSALTKLNSIHQRHKLIESLGEESEKNVTIMNGNYRFYDAYMHWADNMETEVDTVSKHKPTAPLPIILPPDWDPAELLNPANAADVSPTATVYTASKDSGLFTVLSTDESRLYARVYHQHETMAAARLRFLDTIARRQQFECNFSPGTPPCAPYLSRMGPEDLKQYNLLLAETELASYNMQMRLDHVYGAHQAVLHGAKNEDDVMHGIRNAMIEHHRIPTRPAFEDPNAQ